jgi:uncharacterized protein (TIGR00251 family)
VSHDAVTSFVKERHDGVSIKVKVIPNASISAIVGEKGGSLEIKLTAPPAEGKANKALLKFLAKKLGRPHSSIAILYGHSSREKALLLTGLDEATAREKLLG